MRASDILNATRLRLKNSFHTVSEHYAIFTCSPHPIHLSVTLAAQALRLPVRVVHCGPPVRTRRMPRPVLASASFCLEAAAGAPVVTAVTAAAAGFAAASRLRASSAAAAVAVLNGCHCTL